MSDNHVHNSFEAAREQAADLLGFVASERIVLPGGDVFEIPNGSLLNDDQQARVDVLEVEAETWDRVDDERDENGALIKRGTGALIVPNRKGGVLVEAYNTQLARALFGERYEAFKAAGGRGNDVWMVWQKMGKIMSDRRAADSKSDGSDSDLAPVSDGDRSGSVDVPAPEDSGVAAPELHAE